ncbi:MAG: energy transducer TonB [Opitutae bacterium]|nr:energy transducer TonB [Opitutae bacterium]
MPIAPLRSIILAITIASLVGCATAPRSSSIPDRIYETREVQTPPQAIHKERPDYPKELRRRGIAGVGVVLFTVLPDGTVHDAIIVQDTHPSFGSAALACIRHWRFKPALIDGNPVACRMSVPIQFKITNG